jgi:hypothetical protein
MPAKAGTHASLYDRSSKAWRDGRSIFLLEHMLKLA